MLHVRKTVLGLTQAEMSAITGASQGTVSKWEAGELDPGLDHLGLIRAEAQRRAIEWDDRWFFEVPEPSTQPDSPEPPEAKQ